MPVFDNRILDKNFSEDNRDGVQAALLKRAEFLREPDRTLFRLLLQGNITRRQIARILNLPAGTVTRRIQRLAARVHDPLVGALVDARCPLPPEHRQLAIEHFLQGQTVSELADLHRLSPLQVREMLAFVRGWHKGITARQPMLAYA